MKRKRVLKKEFFITLLIKQNKWHRFGVLVHTLALVVHLIKNSYTKNLVRCVTIYEV